MLSFINWILKFFGTPSGSWIKISREEFIRNNGFEFEERISRKRELQLHRHGFQFLISVDDEEKTNVFWKKDENEELFIFDCEYLDKMSEHGRILSKTAVFFEFSNECLYHFNLHPENLFEKFKQLLGNEDIDFDDYPVFSKNYSLRAENKEIVVLNFPKELVEFIGSKKGVNIEARKNSILIYDKNANYVDLYELALSIKGILVRDSVK